MTTLVPATRPEHATGPSRRPGIATAGAASIRATHAAAGRDIVRTHALTKRYGDHVAVDALDLTVRSGEVYGFLGPNGAGKTTTLRMLVGLIRPTSGSANVLGSAPGTPESLARTGAMIETPAFYPFLSGEQNLKVLARYAGVPIARIGGVLEQVDLLARAGDPFRSYSLGIKQRLGVAAALLKDPALLILDEPTNGLDPAGMAEMRTLIRSLGQGERTVLLSSHLMHEIEQISDRVGIVTRGRLVAEGSVDELRGVDHLLVRVDPDRMRAAQDMLAGIPGLRASAGASGLLRVETAPGGPPVEAAAINARLVGGGLAVHELRPERASLESVFFALTGASAHTLEGESHA